MDYIYTTKQLTIKTRLNDNHILIPWGDVHRDTPACDIDRWQWFLKNAKKTVDENASVWFVSIGDTHDFASFSEVNKIRNATLHETTMGKFDFIAQEDNRKFCQEIEFMRGKLLGFIEGNHGWVLHSGKTANEDLAERMNTESLGWLCHYTLNFEFMDRRFAGAATPISQNVYIVLCHGKGGGGKTAGNSVNQVAWLKEIFPAADIYIEGHDHERWARPISVLMPMRCKGGIKLKQKRQMLCRSGSFMKGYSDGMASYVVRGLYRPADLGALQLHIGFHRDRRDGEDRLITDIKALI